MTDVDLINHRVNLAGNQEKNRGARPAKAVAAVTKVAAKAAAQVVKAAVQAATKAKARAPMIKRVVLAINPALGPDRPAWNSPTLSVRVKRPRWRWLTSWAGAFVWKARWPRTRRWKG